MAETAKHIDEIVDDGTSWYAVRLFTIRLEEVKAFFIENGLECFVPQQYVVVEGSNGRPHEILRPVVRNLIFVKQAAGEQQFRKIIQDADYKISVLRKSKDSQEYALIPHEQMYEFRLMCNPEITMRKFLSSEEARMKAGTEVFVKFGPLKGLSGRLVRSSKKYYLLKEVPGIGVMLKVSRWCCVPAEDRK
ncbi:UpxY family transcription antiterminator [Prevotella multiformis]|jgi:putative updY protein|uniref:UpxY family transcription antiterminator n=1 Tax=Prevotella multiformis TaxID=282402 RepID=UPI001BABA0CD|nr:UpxY family transcription antiterminator [Prevotella multiformis]QUB71039.1 UpxY family transcription antiterminator [Prevotella multiformis]